MPYPPAPTDKHYGDWFPAIPTRGVPTAEGVRKVDMSAMALQDDREGNLASAGTAETLSAPKRLELGVLRVWVSGLGQDSRSYDDGPSFDYAQQGIVIGDDDTIESFCFAPGVEEKLLKIRWLVHGKPNIKSAKLELYCRGHKDPIWAHHWGNAWGKQDEDVAAFPAQPPGPALFGQMDFSQIKVDPGLKVKGDDGQMEVAFPKGLLTVARSPYQLRLVVSGCTAKNTPADGDKFVYPMTSWTYFHVAIDSFKYRFGKLEWLSSARPDIDQEFRERVVGTRKDVKGKKDFGLEGALIEELRAFTITDTKTSEEAMDAASHHLVALLANHNSKRGADKDAEIYKNIWGLGPRLPLVATARIRMLGGSWTEEHAADVLAGARLLWDWEETAPDRWRKATTSPTDGDGEVTRRFLEPLFKASAEDHEPQGSFNCPVTYGGKRGDDQAPIFPPQQKAGSGKGSLPYKVVKARQRTWAVTTVFDDQGETGVLFHPSRMGGDVYRVRTYLMQGNALDKKDPIDPKETASGSPGVFEVLRRVEVHHLAAGAFPGQDLDTMVATVIARARAQASVDLQVRRVVIDAPAYKDLMDKALKRVAKIPGALARYRYFGLEARRLLDLDSLDSSLLELRGWDDFKARMEDAFEHGALRLIHPGTAALEEIAEEVTGGAAGTTGARIDLDEKDKSGAPVCYLLSDPGKTPFSDGETLTGVGTGKAYPARYASQAHSCWGIPAPAFTNTTAHGKAVMVNFPTGAPVKLDFKAGRFSSTVSSNLDDDMQKRLRTAYKAAAEAADDQAPFQVGFEGHEGTSKSSKRRIANVRNFLDELGREGMIIDRKAVYDKYQQKTWCFTSEDAWRSEATDTDYLYSSLVHALAAVYAEENKIKEGILLIHSSRVTSRGDKDTPMGGWVNGALPAEVDLGLVYLATPDPQVYPKALQGKGRLKEPWAVFLHELGHGMCLPHAPLRPGRTRGTPPSPEPKLHVKEESCIMSYDPESNQFCGLCMLRLRGWSYKGLRNETALLKAKVEITLGDPQRIFRNHAGKISGRQERLQVLGLFNRPLGLASHARFQDEFKECWEYSWKRARKLLPGLDGNAMKALGQELKGYLVEGGELPKEGAQARLRVWGGFTPFYSNLDMSLRYHGTASGSTGPEPERAYKMNAVRADLEAAYHLDNPALCAYPLVVTVTDDQGTPLPGIEVRVALVKPEDPTPWAGGGGGARVAGGTSFVQGTGTPAADPSCTGWLQKNVEGHKKSPASDPQQPNTHAELGGKRQLGADGDVVTPRAADGLRNVFSPMPGSPLQALPQPVDPTSGDAVKHAVKLVTDKSGRAEVLFTPSFIGGDRYKLEAVAIDPSVPGRPAASVKTGTMVVWRTLRISAYYQVQNIGSPGELSANQRAFIDQWAEEWIEQKRRGTGDLDKRVAKFLKGKKYNRLLAAGDYQTLFADARFREAATNDQGGLPSFLDDLSRPLPTHDLKADVGVEAAKAYCEVIFEDDALAPQPLDTAFWREFHRRARQILSEYPDALLPAYGYLESFRLQLTATGKRTFKATIPVKFLHGQVLITTSEAALDREAVAHDYVAGGLPADTLRGKLVALNAGDQVIGNSQKPKQGPALGIRDLSGVDYQTGDVLVSLDADYPGELWIGYFPTEPIDVVALWEGLVRSPFLFNFNTYDEYNRRRRPGYVEAEQSSISGGVNSLTRFEMLAAKKDDRSLADTVFLRALSAALADGNGQCYCPGLLIVQAHLFHPIAWRNGDSLGGKGVGNTVLLFPGVATDPASRDEHLHYLALHECGHAWYGIHARQEPGAWMELHEALDKPICIMGEQAFKSKNASPALHGGFCGKCLANLRGMLVLEDPLRISDYPDGATKKVVGDVKKVRSTGVVALPPAIDSHPHAAPAPPPLVTTADQGVCVMNFHPQEMANWCWAAASQMMRGHFLKEVITQKDLAGAALFGDVKDWPDAGSVGEWDRKHSLALVGLDHDSSGEGNVLTWDEIKAEIKADRPFIFARDDHYYVCYGFKQTPGHVELKVYDPMPVGVGAQVTMTWGRYVTYVEGGGANYYNIRKKT